VPVIGGQEVQDLLDKLGRITTTPQFAAALYTMADHVGFHAEEVLGHYPELPEPAPELPLFYTRQVTVNGSVYTFQSKFKSEKQQRYVAWLYKKGKVPYRRKGTLGKTITHQVIIDNEGVRVRVGSNKEYADKVIGPPTEQSHYMAKRGWISGETQLDNSVDIFTGSIIADLSGFIDGYTKS